MLQRFKGFEYSNAVKDIQKSIDEYNPGKKTKY